MDLITLLQQDQNFPLRQGIFIDSHFPNTKFEAAYLDVRQKEGRLLSDDEVRSLPNTTAKSPFYKEWEIRKRSASRLLNYIDHRTGNKVILELGCGNGWLSYKLSRIHGSLVIGLDVNKVELTQAARVFEGNRNLAFVLGNIFEVPSYFRFDYIVLASSLQYFDDSLKLIGHLQSRLTETGEIHILDTPIYTATTVTQAKYRSAKYFSAQNAALQDHYFHHTEDTLKALKSEYRYDPNSLLNTLKRMLFTDSPFPWIKISR